MFDPSPLDDESDPPAERFLLWRPAAPDRDIPCTCGDWLTLRGRRNTCANCQAVYDAYGRLVAAGCPDRQR